ncbi:cytochrome P450 [Plantactinospora sp. S1510]|uniref:Cytochrome P450 n=2 Tax=Plantactinospora alkalitolerans TaxID=2789879 RepID=A0ABS0H2R5_9ACTN|nr:cytochrome P450 [Plantactinospora alkalitolerans]
MLPLRALPSDQSLRLAVQGYGWLPNLRRRYGTETVQVRLLGQPAVGLYGPDAARFFYDEEHIRRHGAIPGPVQVTLFGRGAVHTLDGADHRHRKAIFTSLLTAEGIATLETYVGRAWDETVETWDAVRPVVLFDEVSQMLTRAVCQWVGIPLAEPEVAPLAADLVAMVDGFGSLGPRHWRARRARSHREQWLADLVRRIRRADPDSAVGSPGSAAGSPESATGSPGSAAGSPVLPGSPVELVARYRDTEGEPLDPVVAAVEVLNLLRPTVAVCWYVTFAAHALHRWPQARERLRSGGTDHVAAFGHEVRRFYPFAPFVGGRAARDLVWQEVPIPAGSLVLLDLYGQNHDPKLWPDPYAFDADRFLGRKIGAFDLVPQGGGDPRTGHRCPGEKTTVALLNTLTARLSTLDYEVPRQDLDIPLHRIPTRPRSGFVLVPR